MINAVNVLKLSRYVDSGIEWGIKPEKKNEGLKFICYSI